MKNKLTISTLLVAITLVLTGCTTTMPTSTHGDYTLEYPDAYTLDEKTEEGVIIVRGDKGRVEIFRHADFDGMRIHGFSSSGEEEHEWKLVPKEEMDLGDGYTAWIFFTEGDLETKYELAEILGSWKK